MDKPILNISELAYDGFPAGWPEHAKDKYEGSKMAWVAQKLGAKKLGYNVTVVPSGKRAFPMHSHRVNEELFFILEGQGEVRIGERTYPIRQGDFIAHPPGGSETAHQIINTGTIDLKYLAISTKESPEIAEYPDSQKFGVMAEGGFRFIGRAGESLGYWDGE